MKQAWGNWELIDNEVLALAGVGTMVATKNVRSYGEIPGAIEIALSADSHMNGWEVYQLCRALTEIVAAREEAAA